VRRFSAPREVALGLGAYGVYLGVRALVLNDGGRRRARRNALRLVALERRLGLHLEPALQRVLLRRRRLLTVLNAAYVPVNVLLSVGWPLGLYLRRHPDYFRLRRAVGLAILGACPVFLVFPCDPPRTVEGFTDTIKESGIDLDSGLVVRLYNPIAAFPSIHMAFAVVTAAAVAETAGSAMLRRLAPGYPPLVAVMVLATANHYVADALAGTALGAFALRAARLLEP
jgi:PAP2 superfamily protein